MKLKVEYLIEIDCYYRMNGKFFYAVGRGGGLFGVGLTLIKISRSQFWNMKKTHYGHNLFFRGISYSILKLVLRT